MPSFNENEQSFGLDARSIAIIERVCRRVLETDGRKVPRRADHARLVQGVFLAKNGGSEIAARSGTTVGSGTVTLYKRDDTALASTGTTAPAYNLSEAAVAADAYLQVVRIGNDYWVSNDRTELKGKLDGDLNAGSSATVSIWEPVSGTETDTGNNITAHDWMLASGKKIASGTKVVISRIGTRWYVIAAGTCPA